MYDAPDTPMTIDVISDVVCPWCYIGKRQLERALEMLRQEGLEFQIHWNPFQLNPDMPPEGRDRAARKAASVRSLIRDHSSSRTSGGAQERTRTSTVLPAST